jgi:hypothetical protein
VSNYTKCALAYLVAVAALIIISVGPLLVWQSNTAIVGLCVASGIIILVPAKSKP